MTTIPEQDGKRPFERRCVSDSSLRAYPGCNRVLVFAAVHD